MFFLHFVFITKITLCMYISASRYVRYSLLQFYIWVCQTGTNRRSKVERKFSSKKTMAQNDIKILKKDIEENYWFGKGNRIK